MIMKKLLVIVVAVFAFNVTALACDICGCGVGSYYIGILPEFRKNIIGLRYRYNSLQTHLGAGGSVSYLTTNERYHTAELWGGWTLGKRFRLMAYMPVNFIEKNSQEVVVSKSGLGDIGVQGFYQVFNQTGMAGSKLLVHSLWAGAGIKLPTGRYQPLQHNTTQQDPNIFQLGTGSWDATLNAMYDLRIHDAGLNTTVSYKINSSNKSDYQYGNKFAGAAQLYYKFKVKELLTIAPNVGYTYETGQRDMNGKMSVDASGGSVAFGSIGVELSFSKFAIGGNYQTPVSQNLASGFVKTDNKAMIHFSVAL